ncbi:probable cytochrome P450 6a13 [Cimex lectularius]|uniref:Cytochrome P450 n=1 Tax=Cimex lectularius TaxID=79782 RepID=A0A8I6S2Q9_CIMLE|nr:probable cytochrome P450 6a13 [Cimex lectularius]
MIGMLLVLIILLLLPLLLWRRTKFYWEKRKIPYVPPTFPFGNIKDIIFMHKTLGEVYDEIYWKFKDLPYGGMYRFISPSIMLRDPELIKAVFVKEFNSFQGNDWYVDPKLEPILGLNPFNLVGSEWTRSRMAVTSSLTLCKIKGMMPQIYFICDNLKAYLELNQNEFLEGYDVFGKYTTDIIASCAFGLDSQSFTDSKSKLREVSSKMFNTGIKGNLALFCALYMKKLGRLLKFKIFSDEINDYFVAIIKEASDYRIKNGISRNDFLQMLIDANLEHLQQGKGPLYNYQEMAAHCMTFFLDGFETTSIFLAFIVHEISLNPKVQTTLRNEIQTVGLKIRDFDFEKLNGLNYLDMVLKETLRKHPPGTTMARLCNKSVVLTNPKRNISLHIEEGMSVTLPMYSLHNDPEYFPNPEIFDPLRFTKENIAKRPEFCYFPFGGGPRSCPGYKFAYTMIKLAVVITVLHFNLESKDNVHTKLELNPLNTFFHSAKDGLWVRYTSLKTKSDEDV